MAQDSAWFRLRIGLFFVNSYQNEEVYHMAVELFCTTDEQKKSSVLAAFDAMQTWEHFEEVYLNCVKESPLSYEAFAEAVHAGDASRAAFELALSRSQMSRDEFNRFLPEFLKFIALCREYPDLAMLSDKVDEIWHAFYLLDRYDSFCLRYIGRVVKHLPCSLYPLYGIEVP